MNKFLRFVLIVLLFSAFLFENAAAQSFNNSSIGVILSNYGRVRIENGTPTRQIDRSSLLVASASDAVFDYWNDAQTIVASQTVASPTLSDYELYALIDNTYNAPPLPPNLQAKISVYGWNGVSYAIVKFNIISTESKAIDAIVGMEVIPQLDGSYGFETVEYIPANDVFAFYSGTSTQVGYKILSANPVSLKTFDWYTGYNSFDTDFYSWMTYAAFDTLYDSFTTEGIVAIFTQPSISLAAGDSTEFFVGIALGADKPIMLANMDDAVTKYNQTFVTAIDDNERQLPAVFNLSQNYPNPFNPQTNISFTLPARDNVRLNVYNGLGQIVSILVNGELNAGEHSIEFNGSNLPSGIYFYTLRTGKSIQTKKMVLMR